MEGMCSVLHLGCSDSFFLQPSLSLTAPVIRNLPVTFLMVVLSNYCMGSIQALLSAPNPDDPLAENIAKHWKTNEAEAVATGKFSIA